MGILKKLFPPAAVGSGILSIIGQLVQNRMNKKMSEYTYAKDKQMWDETNKYNSPAEQMKRYGAAGLNPNLVYSQGNAGNAPASMPKYNPPERKVPQLDTMSIITQYQDLKNKIATEDLLKTQKDLVEKNITNKDVMNGLLNLKLNLSDPIAFQKAMSEGGWGDILPAGTQSTTAYSLQAKELANAKTTQQVNAILQNISRSKTGKKIDEQKLKWVTEKYNRLLHTGVNIDKDELWQRILSDVFGDSFYELKEKFKTKIPKFF